AQAPPRIQDIERLDMPEADGHAATFKTMVESIPHLVLAYDSSGRCVHANSAFKEFAAEAEQPANEGNLDQLLILPPDSSLSIADILRQTAATGMWVGELALRGRGESQSFFQASFFHLGWELPEPVAYAAILMDISRQKQYEADIVQNEVMRSIGMLAGGVAHNLNNLLVGVMGYASLLKPQLRDNQKNLKYISMIESSSSKAAELTRQLLSFSQRGETVAIDLEVNDAMKIAASLVRKIVPGKIDVEVDYTKTPCIVHADPAHLEHIILQLAVNAADAMPDGGQLSIKAELLELAAVGAAGEASTHDPRLTPGSYVKFTFRDTGHGIPAEKLKDIFHPFFTTRQFTHRGLGLSSSYGLVQRYGGVMTVESEVDKGTTFEVYLPRAERPADDEGSPETGAPKDTDTKTLLIVDDEKMVRDFFASVLEQQPYDLLFAADGCEAMKIFADDPQAIDLVFMDMVMPRKNGLETFHEMVQLCPDVRVIFSSGFSVDENLAELIGKGCADFIRKPFDIQQFLTKLREAFGESASGA
ncbi:response regulator, partial [Candidatus Sumerlaeota bacterium]